MTLVTFMGINHGCHRNGWMVQFLGKGQCSWSDREMTQGLGHQKHQDAVIHRIQLWEITNYIPHAVGLQLSLLLEVCHRFG